MAKSFGSVVNARPYLHRGCLGPRIEYNLASWSKTTTPQAVHIYTKTKKLYYSILFKVICNDKTKEKNRNDKGDLKKMRKKTKINIFNPIYRLHVNYFPVQLLLKCVFLFQAKAAPAQPPKLLLQHRRRMAKVANSSRVQNTFINQQHWGGGGISTLFINLKFQRYRRA